MDCDPYLGACRFPACSCRHYSRFPTDSGDYIYNPSVRQPEQELCSECGHLQTEHDLDNAGFDRETLKEFSPDVAQQYHIRLSPDEPPRHPADIPQFQLQEFYAKNPEFPGSSERGRQLRMAQQERERESRGSGLRVLLTSQDEEEDGLGGW